MLNVKLKSFSLKDIKALKKRKKKQKYIGHYKDTEIQPLPEPDCQVSPIKFIDPFNNYHRIISDFIILEDISKIEEKYFSALKIVFSLKHIVSVDFYEDFTYAKFQNSSNYPYSPIDLVIYRLRSLSDQKSFKLAETVSEYKELCLLIKNTKLFGYRKEILDSFNPKYLKFLKNYFATMMVNTMTAEQSKTYMSDIIDNNKKNPVFFFVYDEYKEYIGTQILGIGVNKIMKRLIGWKDFGIYEKEVWCVHGKGYIDYICKIMNEYMDFKEVFYQTLFINTIYGFLKCKFEVKTFFVTMPTEKKVFTSCISKEWEFVDDVPLTVIDSLYDEKEPKNEKGDPEKCERNKMWSNLIDSYFEFSKKH